MFCCVPLLLQIFLWEQNLEQFHMDLFRFRCYLASLQGGELPNPKRLLAFASRPTKLAMGRLGIFSVSSFHALVNITTLFLHVNYIESGFLSVVMINFYIQSQVYSRYIHIFMHLLVASSILLKLHGSNLKPFSSRMFSSNTILHFIFRESHLDCN